MERPSQKIIAKKLGISTAAVSLALRDTGTLSKELTARVKETALAIGYRPNPILASLASKRFRNSNTQIGIPIALLDFSDQKSAYKTHLTARAEALGYSLSVITPPTLAKYATPSQTLHNRGVQGIILFGPIPRGSFRDDFNWDDFSVVQCGRFLEPLPFDTVRANIFQAIKLAYHKVKEHGYKRIGFALGRHPQILEDDESRLSTVLGLQHIEENETERIPPFFDHLQNKASLAKWVKKHRPECVIGFNIGQCANIIEAGLKVPDDIAFACLHLKGDGVLGDGRNLSIAGMEQHIEEIACQSINLIDQSIRHHTRGQPKLPKHVLVPSVWYDGESLPKRELQLTE